MGDVIAEKYRIRRVLGKGGMGVVMAADHLVLNHVVALKVLYPQHAANTTSAARFALEAHAAAQLKSEHAVRILDVDRLEQGSPYIVMEHLDGSSLDEILRMRGSISYLEAVRWIVQACNAIGEAHERGIIHRDVKPENLFLAKRPTGEPIVKVLDFGLVKSLTDASSPMMTGDRMLGSPQYMSPEQIVSSSSVDARTDVWSLGATLYELITGQPVFDAADIRLLFSLILRGGPPTPVRELRPEVPPEVEAIIMRCLERDAELRFENARALGNALARTMPTLMVNTPEPIAIPVLPLELEPTPVPWFVLATVAMAMFICFFVAAQESKMNHVQATPATRVVEAPRTLETSSATRSARPKTQDERTPARSRSGRRAARANTPASSSSASAFM